MINQRALQLLMATTISISGATMAETTSPASERLDGHWLLAKYDSNGDEVISADEIAYKREKVFGHMDADADGVVTLDEYQGVDARRREVLLQARFLKLDLDNDGILSGQEYSSYLGSFDRFDSDGDGYVSRHEMVEPQASSTATVDGLENVVDDAHCLLWLCVRTSF